VALWQAGQALATRFDCYVDLVDLIAASTVSQHRIITTGRRLFALDGSVDAYDTSERND